MKKWTVGVFVRRGNRVPWLFSCYTLWYDPHWDGFLGKYAVEAQTRTMADAKAIYLAQADLDAGRLPLGCS